MAALPCPQKCRRCCPGNSRSHLRRRKSQCLLWPKADVSLCAAHVCFCPKADFLFASPKETQRRLAHAVLLQVEPQFLVGAFALAAVPAVFGFSFVLPDVRFLLSFFTCFDFTCLA